MYIIKQANQSHQVRKRRQEKTKDQSRDKRRRKREVRRGGGERKIQPIDQLIYYQSNDNISCITELVYQSLLTKNFNCHLLKYLSINDGETKEKTREET